MLASPGIRWMMRMSTPWRAGDRRLRAGGRAIEDRSAGAVPDSMRRLHAPASARSHTPVASGFPTSSGCSAGRLPSRIRRPTRCETSRPRQYARRAVSSWRRTRRLQAQSRVSTLVRNVPVATRPLRRAQLLCGRGPRFTDTLVGVTALSFIGLVDVVERHREATARHPGRDG